MRNCLLFLTSLIIFMSCGQSIPDSLDDRDTTRQMHLLLPKDGPDSVNAISKIPKESQLSVLVSGSSDIYAYMGGDIQKGKSYNYKELTDMLKKKNSDSSFGVAIKPSKSSTYKNLVNILDVMTTADIKRYALISISDDEERFLKHPVPVTID